MVPEIYEQKYSDLKAVPLHKMLSITDCRVFNSFFYSTSIKSATIFMKVQSESRRLLEFTHLIGPKLHPERIFRKVG